MHTPALLLQDGTAGLASNHEQTDQSIVAFRLERFPLKKYSKTFGCDLLQNQDHLRIKTTLIPAVSNNKTAFSMLNCLRY